MARAKVAPGRRQVVLPAPRAYQQDVLESAARCKLLLCGRRLGKSKVAVICALEGHGPRPGYWRGAVQGGRIGWFVPSHKHASARDAWADLKAAAAGAGVAVREEERLIVLPGGGSVRMTSGHDPEAARGMFLNQVQSAKCKMQSEEPCGVHRGLGIDGAVVDERSLQPEALWAAGIRPTLSDYGGWALLCGTVPPELEAHWFVRLYRLATWSGGRGIK